MINKINKTKGENKMEFKYESEEEKRKGEERIKKYIVELESKVKQNGMTQRTFAELLHLVINEDIEDLRIAILNFSNNRIPLKQVISQLESLKVNLKTLEAA